MKKKPRRIETQIRLRNLIAALHRALFSIKLADLPSRVRDLPDERTARYYTALGLLSRPARFDGRRALYGRRHLIELIAIKRLQSQGHGIRAIQERLRRAPLRRLSAVADVDPVVVDRAMREASVDPALDLWPRPDPGAPPVRPAAPESVRCFKIQEGVYLTMDPAAGGNIRQSVMTFLDAQFP
ncbi:MAG: hypothetical protein A3G34_12755 [Candidatus Lindowbacteria bacterium RIFCSPLOWO2_12_FULL_62_27]|nr:MAG: hypothetical protein A3I06_15310 [Candidatus Lindowbacteria bacterium RIFCSPLOWO2_02_FULL_62_12]OGH62464.1 MAG: hypothetical protein A3G34_12755 [Candidatus Lindowbacteria bacterium RIFCSPLOWO2_12_FULL_62_27]